MGCKNHRMLPPPTHGSQVEIRVAPDSERLQVMTPWPAWDGHDFLDLPVLMKTQGKTTTDPNGIKIRIVPAFIIG